MTQRTDAEARPLRLSDSELVPKDHTRDVHGYDVLDEDGEQVGTVEQEREVRFLDVGAGGFLGIGEKHFLIPVEAVLEVKEDRLTVDQGREKVLDSPPFDQKVVPQPEEQREVYEYYGYPPFGLGTPSGGS